MPGNCAAFDWKWASSVTRSPPLSAITGAKCEPYFAHTPKPSPACASAAWLTPTFSARFAFFSAFMPAYSFLAFSGSLLSVIAARASTMASLPNWLGVLGRTFVPPGPSLTPSCGFCPYSGARSLTPSACPVLSLQLSSVPTLEPRVPRILFSTSTS
jgi:hypothetical protein